MKGLQLVLVCPTLYYVGSLKRPEKAEGLRLNCLTFESVLYKPLNSKLEMPLKSEGITTFVSVVVFVVKPYLKCPEKLEGLRLAGLSAELNPG